MKFAEKNRYIVLCSVLGAVFIYFIATMMTIQIADGESYAEAAVMGSSVNQLVTAARGEIVDADGVAFTGNTTIYNLCIDSNYLGDSNLNRLILTLTGMCTEYGSSWVDSLPITQSTPYQFTPDSDDAVATLKKKLNVSSSATVDDVMYWLRDQYNLNSYTDSQVLDTLRQKSKLGEISDADALGWYRTHQNTPDASDADLIAALRAQYNMYTYTDEQVRLLAGVRYTMTLEEFSAANPYTFAVGVPDKLVASVKERSAELPGVDAVVSAQRQNLTGNLAAHVLGVTGPLSAEDYAGLKDSEKTYSLSNPAGYRVSDIIGRSGIEKAFENELRGQNGLRTVVRDQSGNVLRVEDTVAAVPGHTVQLTIKQNVQRVAQDALEARIKLLNATAPAMKGREAEAGAVVAINVKTGGIIAMASYPTYDLSQYYTNYNNMMTAKPSPLLNRATQGLYTVGSTYKPSVAVSALKDGLITSSDTVNCTGRYTYYDDYQPACEGVHGNINVMDALRVSCNIFFYDMGRRLGIEAINDTSYKLGLGHSTGIEIPEAAGQLSSPETRAKMGEKWMSSYNLQSAIGQLDNQFTIVQMASYASTLANNGKRMQVHLVDKIWDYNMKNVIYQSQPTVVATVDAPDSVWSTVREGMTRSSYNDQYGRGTSYGAWGFQRGKTWSDTYGVDIVVASKTGSPQAPNNLVNSMFICYAPADDPEIAVAVIMEKGYEGDRASPIAKAVLTEYFFGKNGTKLDQAIAAGYVPPAEASSTTDVSMPVNPSGTGDNDSSDNDSSNHAVGSGAAGTLVDAAIRAGA